MQTIRCEGAPDGGGGWTGRLTTAAHLVGPPGIVQGGIASALGLVVARTAVPDPAPVTSIDARLHRPTPAGTELVVRSTRDGIGTHVVEVGGADGSPTVTSTVVLAGHEVTPRVADLVAMAAGPVPPPEPQEVFTDCWVCGTGNPEGLHLSPGFSRPDVVLQSWWPDDACEDPTRPGMVDPVAIAAVLDCPTVWSARDHLATGGWVGYLLAGMRITFFAPTPMHDGYRIVATPDQRDGRKVQGRAALVSEEGGVHAVASAFQIATSELPAVS